MSWLRQIMNAETFKMINEIHPESLDALEISGQRWKTANFRSYVSVDYPDICIDEKRYPGEYDLILAEQVWEHLKYPRRGTVNCLDMLRPGGYLMLTTPFLVRYHPHPTDCTRWTQEGMKYFLEEAGFPEEQIRVGSWGNLSATIGNLSQWVDYDNSHNAIHPLDNDPMFPNVVWALARKVFA